MNRTSSCFGARLPQPTHVLSGAARSRVVASLLVDLVDHGLARKLLRERDLGRLDDDLLGGLGLDGGQLTGRDRVLDLVESEVPSARSAPGVGRFVRLASAKWTTGADFVDQFAHSVS